MRPDAPTNVLASDGLPTVIITWDAVTDAASYTIYRSTAELGGYYTIGRTALTTWDDTTAVLGVTYWYTVSVTLVSGGGCSLPSTPDSGYAFSTPISPPAAPIIIEAVVI